ncbi:MAG: hypothetical protein AB7Q29_11625 [Vicinamibacterales bacterium]
MAVQTDALKELRAARDAASKLTTFERTLRDREAALVAERDRVKYARPPRDEVISNAHRLIDRAGAEYHHRHADAFVTAVAGAIELRHSPDRDVRVPPQLPVIESLSFEALCVFVPDLVKQRFEHIIREYRADIFGLPQAEREQTLARLDVEIAAVRDQHTQLVDGAREAGLELALLPVVREARETEARDRERQEEIARQRLAVRA